jgi:hypothetical protein
MELAELQAIWQQYDKNILENTKINKEVLKRILISKPQKRLSWEKMKAGLSLILPIVLVFVILVPNITYRLSLDFYAGAFMFGAVFSVLYYWSVRYFLLLGSIDFSDSITLIKKNIKQLEKYKIKIKRLGFTIMPFGLLGVYLLGGFPVFSKDSILPVSLIMLVMILSIYYTFKYSVFEQFRVLNREIEEVEKLEKD